jgi:long-chain acyl-CoA synthetase
MIDFLINTMQAHAGEVALATPRASVTYGQLLERIGAYRAAVDGLAPGRVVSIEGDYGLESVAAFLALADAGHVIVPLSPDSSAHHDAFRATASVEYRIFVHDADGAVVHPTGVAAAHPFYEGLRADGHPGLVLFSSGSSGQPKAAVHDLTRLLQKFKVPRQRYRTLVFLLLDHIGGINSLLYTVSNGGTIVLARERSATAVCEAIEAHRVELLPTSPTFLNLLLLSGLAERHDLSSLRLITYGTEPMPASTLERACQVFPHARFLQTYGLTELGIMRSQSRDSSSLWVRVGGEDFEWKIVDGQLRIKARSAMLGYLNAPSPFDEEGYFNTGDYVECDGEWLRILGRKSDVVNVGGQKVHPAEVENVLLQMDNVIDAAVHGEPNPLTGQMVVAIVRLRDREASDQFKLRMRRFCAGRLSPYQVPARVQIVDEPVHSARFKRVRKTPVTT